MGIALAAAAVVATAGGCGSDEHARPRLRRPAAAAWCPAAIVSVNTEKLGQAPHGNWDARAVIGLDFDDAIRLARRHGCVLRMVGGEDADPNAALTMDLRFDRVNVDVTDGVVVALNDATGGIVG
jgi:hypothetical protein